MVGLAGPSGSGKTVFSRKVQSLIPGCAILSMDDYNDASRLVDGNFDDPRLTDYDTLLDNISCLQRGQPARAPIYDFKASRRVGYREVGVPTSRVVIVEGIYALSSRVRPLLDLRVSVTGGVHFDLVKRVLRDISRSGQQPEAIIQQISDTVYPMYKAFIEPDLACAHLRIYNTFNPFTGFMDATYILKSDKPVDPDACRALLAASAANSLASALPTPTPSCSGTPAGASGASTPASSVAAPTPPAPTVTSDSSETYDIYLLPPNEDPETCTSWLRMRNRDGRYSLMFEEWVVDGPFIISPRITFEVGVRVLGGLMALGYEIGTIMKRTSTTLTVTGGHASPLTIKTDDIEGMGRTFVQVQGKDRAAVAAAGAALGLEGSYLPRSYIELVQLEQLTESFRTVTDGLRKRFAVGGEPLFDEDGVGTPPSSAGGSLVGGSLLASTPAFTRTTGFAVRGRGRGGAGAIAPSSERPTLASSAPVRGGLLADGSDAPLAADTDDDDTRAARRALTRPRVSGDSFDGLVLSPPPSPLPPRPPLVAGGGKGGGALSVAVAKRPATHGAAAVTAAAQAAAAGTPHPHPPSPLSDAATGTGLDGSPVNRPPSAGTESAAALADACARLAAAVDALDARVDARSLWGAAVAGAAVGVVATLVVAKALQ